MAAPTQAHAPVINPNTGELKEKEFGIAVKNKLIVGTTLNPAIKQILLDDSADFSRILQTIIKDAHITIALLANTPEEAAEKQRSLEQKAKEIARNEIEKNWKKLFAQATDKKTQKAVLRLALGDVFESGKEEITYPGQNRDIYAPGKKNAIPEDASDGFSTSTAGRIATEIMSRINPPSVAQLCSILGWKQEYCDSTNTLHSAKGLKEVFTNTDGWQREFYRGGVSFTEGSGELGASAEHLAQIKLESQAKVGSIATDLQKHGVAFSATALVDILYKNPAPTAFKPPQHGVQAVFNTLRKVRIEIGKEFKTTVANHEAVMDKVVGMGKADLLAEWDDIQKEVKAGTKLKGVLGTVLTTAEDKVKKGGDITMLARSTAKDMLSNVPGTGTPDEKAAKAVTALGDPCGPTAGELENWLRTHLGSFESDREAVNGLKTHVETATEEFRKLDTPPTAKQIASAIRAPSTPTKIGTLTNGVFFNAIGMLHRELGNVLTGDRDANFLAATGTSSIETYWQNIINDINAKKTKKAEVESILEAAKKKVGSDERAVAASVSQAAKDVLAKMSGGTEADKMEHLRSLYPNDALENKDALTAWVETKLNDHMSKEKMNEELVTEIDKALDEGMAKLSYMSDITATATPPAHVTKARDDLIKDILKDFSHRWADWDNAHKLLEKIGVKHKIKLHATAVTGPADEKRVMKALANLLNTKNKRVSFTSAKTLDKKIKAMVAGLTNTDPAAVRPLITKLIEEALADDTYGIETDRTRIDNLAYLLKRFGTVGATPATPDEMYFFATDISGIGAPDTIHTTNENTLKQNITDAIANYIGLPTTAGTTPAAGTEMKKQVDKLLAITTVRGDIFTAISSATPPNTGANTISLGATQAQIDTEANRILAAAETSITGAGVDKVATIASALYLPKDNQTRVDCLRDITNKLNALVSPLRFEAHDVKLLAQQEVDTIYLLSADCESTIAEMVRDHNPANHPRDAYLTNLENAIKTPSASADSKKLYLYFKELASKNNQLQDIDMLQYLTYLNDLKKNGYAKPVESVRTAGFDHNMLVRLQLTDAANWTTYSNCLQTVNNTTASLRLRLSTLAEKATKSAEEQGEHDLLQKIFKREISLTCLFKEAAENYNNQPNLSPEGKVFLRLLSRIHNPAGGTGVVPTFANRGASSLEEVLAQAYFYISALETTPVHRIVQKIGPGPSLADLEKQPMTDARSKYAKHRRTLTNFGWFRRVDKDDIADSRKKYTEEKNKYFTETLRQQFPDMSDKAAVTKRLMELIEAEEIKLCATEIKEHDSKASTKIRSYLRSRTVKRITMGAGILGLSLLVTGTGTGLLLGGGLAAIRGLSMHQSFTGSWEGIRNRFGKTKRISRDDLDGKTPEEIRELLASAQSLAVSTKPRHQKWGNAGLKADPTTVNELFDYAGKTENRDKGIGSYRQRMGRELWERQNTQFKKIISDGIDAGNDIGSIIRDVTAEQVKIYEEVEKREHEIRRNNMKKHWIAVPLALTVGLAHTDAFSWLKGKIGSMLPWGGGSSPIPSTGHGAGLGGGGSIPPGPSVPTSPPGSGVLGVFTMPDSIPGDPDPGLYQAIANKLSMSPAQVSTMVHDPDILKELGAARPDLANTARSMIDNYGNSQVGLNYVHGGDKFNISTALANKLASITGHSATDVVRDLSK